MTAEAFDRLLYTDCLPGTGRGAGGGFQVQAQSAGVDGAQSRLATGSLLYEVQVPWLNQRRPVGEFPLGLAHASGEGYGTGQGRYLGKEARGLRDGNHLTDCLLTRDGDLYGTIRPAQLWRSPLWRQEPWPGTECPRLDAAELEPGPLTVEAVADWARARPEREPALARLLSVLEDPAGRRVVIVCEGPDEAVTWIAAATLLLPARYALEVSFKVFSSIPLRAEHRIAAAPAALFPQLAPGRDGTAFVIDARTCATDEVAVTERAAFFAGQLTTADPYDVIDAVELADILAGGTSRSPDDRDARLTAWALTRQDEPLTDPAALGRWLRSAPQGILDEHGAAVTALILATVSSPSLLRWIDRAVTGRRLSADPAEVRRLLLSAELAEVRDGRETAHVGEVLATVPLEGSAARDAESELSSALLLGTNRHADLLLCLARRHRITPDLTQPLLQQRLRAFAAAWVDGARGYHADWWALRIEVLDCAHDELRHRLLHGGGVAEAASAIRRLNRYFADRGDPSDPIDCHIQASLIAEGPEPRAKRISRLRSMLAVISTLQEPGAAAEAAAGLQQSLVAWGAADGEAAVAVLTGLPESVPIEPAIAEQAAQALTHMSQRPTRELLDLLAGLDRQGKVPASRQLAELLAADRQLQAFASRADDERVRSDLAYFQDTVRLLRKADPAVIRIRLDEVLTACLRARHPHLSAVVLTELKSPIPRLLVERWAATFGTRNLVDDGVWCVNCLDYPALPERREDQLTAAVRDYAQTLPKDQFDGWYDRVAREVGPGKRARWESVFGSEPDGQQGGTRHAPRISLWRSRDGGRS